MTNSTRESRQRKFLRDLFPMNGQHIASHVGGFTPPSMEGQLSELKESFKLWQEVSASGADERISETAWWMTRLMDPHHHADMVEMLAQQTQLTAFSVSMLGQLMNEGIIKWADEDMELPPIVVENMSGIKLEDELTDDQRIDVARLLDGLEGDYDNE
jgi:hypothetical protein